MFHADLHIHSRFSRACSKSCDAGALAWWAVRKGVSVVGTGDFTHPAWAAELAESLEPAEPGLLRLRPGLQSELRRTSPASCEPRVRFLLSAEISTIYKRDGVTRKVHHLIYAPTFEAAGAITAALAKIGNLASDGRPIHGLDSRHLLEITLNAGPGCYLVPAHIWTPWFAVLGSKSGFDVIDDCYLDLAGHIFAVETGLSSDPPMNWMCSGLDRYQLVSNSDAHSPPMIGREATTFSTGLDYFAMAEALRTGPNQCALRDLPGLRQATHDWRAAPRIRTGRPPAGPAAGRGGGIHQPGIPAGDRRRDPGQRPEEQEGRRRGGPARGHLRPRAAHPVRDR